MRLSEESLAANSLGSCLKEIAEGFPKVSARSSKLTFFLEDCLNRSSDIHLLYEIDTELPLKAQVSMLSFNTCINRPITLRKVLRILIRTTLGIAKLLAGSDSTATNSPCRTSSRWTAAIGTNASYEKPSLAPSTTSVSTARCLPKPPALCISDDQPPTIRRHTTSLRTWCFPRPARQLRDSLNAPATCISRRSIVTCDYFLCLENK